MLRPIVSRGRCGARTHTHIHRKIYCMILTHTTTRYPFVRTTSGAAPLPLLVFVVVVDADVVVIILYLCSPDGGRVNQPFPHNIWTVFHRAYAGLYYTIYTRVCIIIYMYMWPTRVRFFTNEQHWVIRSIAYKILYI